LASGFRRFFKDQQIYHGYHFMASGTSLLLIAFYPFAATADSPVEKFVASIKSVKQAKSELKSNFEYLDQCQVGSCMNEISIAICEVVGALDVKVNGQIIGAMSSDKAEIAISPDDLRELNNHRLKPVGLSNGLKDRIRDG
jgi:hypothetical protein